MGGVLAALIIAITLLIGGLVVSQVGTQTDGVDSGRVQTAAILGPAGETVKIDSTTGTNERVVNSRGYAVNLTGAVDSSVESSEPIAFASDETFTLSLWARVDAPSETDTMTALQAGNRVTVVYNGTDSEWVVRYYDRSARTTYRLNATAVEQPDTWANLQVWRNGTHVALYRNATRTDILNVSADDTGGSVTFNATNFDGRIEEVRTDDAALNATQRNRVFSQPVAPLRGSTKTARIMFDQPGKATQLLFYASGVIEQSNVTFSDGLDGAVMDRKNLSNDLAGESDYVWDTDGPRITPLAGGELDGAPVAYVSYTRNVGKYGIVVGFANAMALAAVIPIVLIAGAIVAIVSKFS